METQETTVQGGLTDTQGRIVRGGAQLVVGGGLDLIIRQLGADLEGNALAPYLPLLYAFGIAWIQNVLEQREVIPTVFKRKPVKRSSGG